MEIKYESLKVTVEEYMKDNLLTYKKMAELLKIGQHTLISFLNGKRTASRVVLFKIEKFFEENNVDLKL
jgi:plasmid maintenance system antidote protein VapI